MFDLNKIQEDILAEQEEKKRLQSEKKASKIGFYGLLVLITTLLLMITYALLMDK